MYLQDKLGPELMDGCGQGSSVIMSTLKQSQELLNFNLRAHANSLPDPGQGEVRSCWNHGEFLRSFQQGQDVTWRRNNIDWEERNLRMN